MAKGSTSRDVALALGISQATVSRAFTPGASISAALRARIHAAADELGYRPNLLARGLIAGRSRLIGMLIAPQTNLLYPELLYELGRRLAAEDHQLLLFPAADEAAAARAAERLRAFRVDAVLATGVLGAADAQALVAQGVPLVTFNRLVPGVPGVSCDFVAAGAALVEKPLAAGCRRFALIGGPAESWVGAMVEQGVRTTLAEAPAARLAVAHAPYDYAEGAPALARAERALGGPADAILCVNDLVAAGCLDARAATPGERAPADGLRTILRSTATAPRARLGGVRQPVAALIEAAVAMLLRGAADGEHRRFAPVVLPD